MNDKEEDGRLRIATVGTFDGVHRGHQLVLKTLREEALLEGLEPLVITFDRHPLSVIAPERAPGLITSTDEKLRLLEAEKVEIQIVPFTEQLRRQTAYEWMKRLHDRLGVRTLIVGYDNTFGSDGVTMNLSDYHALGDVTGIRVIEAPVLDGISSSAVRKMIMYGDIDKAGEMLGHTFRIQGTVRSGNHIGTKIGFPTANILPQEGLILPAEGVYAAKVRLPDGTIHPVAVNIGKRPTIGDLATPIVEANILGFNGDLYGRKLSLEIIRKVRDEVKFDSLEELCRQLEKDVVKVREICSEN